MDAAPTAEDGSQERSAALLALDGFLRYALGQVPGRDGQPLLGAGEAKRAVDESRLAIAAQPYLSEVTRMQFSAAVERASKDPQAAALLRPARREFDVLDDNPALGMYGLEFDNGIVKWTLSPRNFGDFGGRYMSEAQMERLILAEQRRLRTKVQQYRTQLHAFIAAALGRIPDTDLGVPLLDPEDVAALVFRLDADVMWAASSDPGAAGVALVSSSAARGMAKRTIQGLRFKPIHLVKLYRPEDDWMREGRYAEDGPPQLIIDTGTFSGAMVNKLAFSPDGRLLAAAGDVVRIWDTERGQLLHTLRGQKSWDSAGGCTDLAFTDDRQLLVSAAGFDESLRVYDVAAPEQIREVHHGHSGHVERLAVSRDGNWLATYGTDRRLQIWNWPERRVVATFAAEDAIDHLSFPSPRNQLLVITGAGTYEWMEVPGGATLSRQSLNQLESRLGSAVEWPDGGSPHPYAIDLAWTEGRSLVGGISRQGGRDSYWCAFWSGAGGPQTVHTHRYYITACTLSADGRWAASADALGNIHVWDTATDRLRCEFPSRIQPFYSVRYDRDDGRIAFGRRPYVTPDWARNRYAALDRAFDFRQRLVTAASAESPPPAISQSNGYQLSLEARENSPLTLVTRDGTGQQLAALPFPASSRAQPLWHSFLRGNAMNFSPAVILGTESGGMVALEPQTLLSRRSFLGHTDRVWSVSQSADDRLLVSGSGDGTIRVWRIEPPADWGNLALLADDDGKVLHVFPNTPTAAAGVQRGDFIQSLDNRALSSLRQHVSATGEWQYRSGQRVTVELQRGRRVWERDITLSRTGDVGRPLFSLFLTADESDWVIWTPEGYYDASPGGHSLIGWHVNQGVDKAARFLPLEQFRETYHNPKLIDALFEINDLPLALARTDAAESGPVQPAAVIAQTPTVRMVQPASDLLTGEGQIPIVAAVASPGKLPLQSVSVLVNGKPHGVKDIQPDARGEATIRRSVPLSPGANEILVVAANGAAQAKGATVFVTYRPSVAPPVTRRLFVLAVGISKYQDGNFDLSYADRDATAFAAMCASQPTKLYESVQTRVLTNEQAVEKNIREEMDWLVQNVRTDDVAILFLSGHGVMDARQNYYLATHEIDPQRLRSTCLRWGVVHDLARDLDGSLLLFADTCHAGGIAGLKTIIGDPVHELAQDQIGTLVFASCGRNAVSIERAEWEQGAFTKALLDTLSNGGSDRDDPRDGLLSISELTFGLDRRVRDLTKGQQIPVWQKPGAVQDFNVFALP